MLTGNYCTKVAPQILFWLRIVRRCILTKRQKYSMTMIWKMLWKNIRLKHVRNLQISAMYLMKPFAFNYTNWEN